MRGLAADSGTADIEGTEDAFQKIITDIKFLNETNSNSFFAGTEYRNAFGAKGVCFKHGKAW